MAGKKTAAAKTAKAAATKVASAAPLTAAATTTTAAAHPSAQFSALRGITKGHALKDMFTPASIGLIADSFAAVSPAFPRAAFMRDATNGLEELELTGRTGLIGQALAAHLPPRFSDALPVFLAALGPSSDAALARNSSTSSKDAAAPDTGATSGMACFFYYPHASFLGLQAAKPDTTFDDILTANLELTKRFTAEFSIRPVISRWPDEALHAMRTQLIRDPNPDVRRLVSEGTRPRLPWSTRLKTFADDPAPILPLLDALKWDESLYVRRSVANHVGDLLKDHFDLGLRICEAWVAVAQSRENAVAEIARRRAGEPAAINAAFAASVASKTSAAGKATAAKRQASRQATRQAQQGTNGTSATDDDVTAVQEQLCWVVRHALRNPDKKGDKKASSLRARAYPPSRL